MNLCPSCLCETDEDVCPVCGYDRYIPGFPNALSVGKILDERYILGRALSRDSEGFTYIAKDTLTQEKVCVREFFPSEIAERKNDTTVVLGGCENTYEKCAAAFIELWKELKALNGMTGIIQVSRVLYSDNVLFAVYDYTECIDLKAYVLEKNSGMLSYSDARKILMPLLSVLPTLHNSGIYHLGISFNTVKIKNDGTVFLSDFRTQYSRRLMSALEPEIAEGFAAPEIYNQDMYCGPWTDVYALGVMFIFCLTGAVIPSAQIIQEYPYTFSQNLRDILPSYVIETLINVIEFNPERRIDSAESFRLAMLGRYTIPLDYISAYADAARRKEKPVFTSQLQELSKNSGAVVNIASSENSKKLNSTTASRTKTTKQAAYIPEKTASTANIARVTAKPQPRQNVSPTATVNTPKKATAATNNVTSSTTAVRKKKNHTGLIILVIFLVCIFGVGLVILFGPDINVNIVDNTPAQTQAPTEQYTLAPVTDNVTVPNFVGLEKDKVMADAEARKILNIDYSDEYSRTVPVGEIVRQSIEAGSDTAKLSTIILYVSCGPKPYVIEDFANTDADAAKTYLEAQGLTVLVEEVANNGSVPENSVEKISPEIGETVYDGDTVTLFVYGAVPTTEPESSETTDDHGQDKGFFEIVMGYLFG